MTDLKAKAIKIIENFPDDRMEYVLRNLESLKKYHKPVDYTEDDLKQSMAAFEDLMEIANRNKVALPADYDYKEEISKELWREYENIA